MKKIENEVPGTEPGGGSGGKAPEDTGAFKRYSIIAGIVVAVVLGVMVFFLVK